MVVISERSIENLLAEVAPRVERLTGWDTNLANLKVKIIKRNQLWEQGLKPKYDHLGVETEAKTDKGKNALALSKALMPYIILGLYEPLTGTMLVLPDNVRFGTNESGLAVTLGHELVHRCQFTNNHQFANMYPALVKRMVGANAFDEDGDEDKNARKYLQAYMTLVEGDAKFVEGQLNKMFYQDAKNKTAHASNFIGLVLFLSTLGDSDGGLVKKLKQYTKGNKIVKAIYQSEGRQGVNKLYRMNERSLYGAFG